MTAELPHVASSAGPARSPRLVHICGFPSSGTDLLSNFMSAHPDVHVRGEFPILHRLAGTVKPWVDPEQVPEVLALLRSGDVYNGFLPSDPSADQLERVDGRISLGAIYATLITHRDVLWCGNKTPQNTEHIPALIKLFPDTRFVFISRDIRDVCLSWQRKWGKDMLMCASKWNSRMLAGLALLEQFPADRVLRLRFEDLTRDPEGTGRTVAAFLGIPDSENFAEYQRHVKRAADGKKNFGAAIQADNQGKWKREMEPSTVRRVEEIALPAMRRLGYEPQFATRHRRLTPVEAARGVLADAYATFVIGNRYRSRNRLRDRLRKAALIIRIRLPSL